MDLDRHLRPALAVTVLAVVIVLVVAAIEAHLEVALLITVEEGIALRSKRRNASFLALTRSLACVP